MESEKSFDAQIKAALENLQAQPDPNGWGLFERQLVADEQLSGDALDSILASRLEGLAVAGKPGDWDDMLQLIEADEAANLIEQEASLDNAAYEKLGNLSAPYRSSHWELMAKRLEEEFSLRYKLYKYKVAELSLMLLLLLTIVRYLPLATDFYHQNMDGDQPVKSAQPHQPAQNLKPATEQPQASLLDNNLENQSAAERINESIAGDHPERNLVPAKKTERLVPTKVTSNNGGTTFQAGQLNYLVQDNPVNEIASMPLAEVVSENPPGTLSDPFWKHQHAQPMPSAQGMMGKADFLDMLSVDFVDTKSAKDFPILKAIPAGKEKQVRFSVFASSDLNYVFTPTTHLNVFDTLVRVENDTAFALGYGGGILASFKFNRWEVQSGGVYSFRRYAPNTPKFTVQTVGYYISEDFKGIQQDLLQVPLNFQYHFKNTGHWRLYGMAGVSGYFITNVVYEIAFKREPAFSSMAPPSGETPSIREEKEFPKGLFDGGSLSDNFYLTANLGLGVERYLSPRWSLFFQPNYHHYLKSQGVGTNKDKFYTLSFYLGTKVSLK